MTAIIVIETHLATNFIDETLCEELCRTRDKAFTKIGTKKCQSNKSLLTYAMFLKSS